MTITLQQIEGFHSRAVNERGNSIEMDSGENAKSLSPMELLLSALGGCSMIDVVHILEKQKLFPKHLAITIQADRVSKETYSEYQKIHLLFHVSMDVPLESVKRAISLSLEKYCSVAKTLEKTAQITWELSTVE